MAARSALSPRAARLTLTGLYGQNSQKTALLASIKMTRSASLTRLRCQIAAVSQSRDPAPGGPGRAPRARFRRKMKLREKATLEFEACETPLLSLGGEGNSEGAAMPSSSL